MTGADTEGSAGTGADTDGTDTDTVESDTDDTLGEMPLVCNPKDVEEPNNSEDSATVLPNITDNDGDGGVVESILGGSDDEDWFAYRGSDVAFAYVDPTGELMTNMALRLCIFVECENGFTEPPTCQGSVDAESPQYRKGCCNSGSAPFVSIDLYCDGDGDDSAFVFMRVDEGYDNVCTPYTIEYHF